jgi:hypothetical protein
VLAHRPQKRIPAEAGTCFAREDTRSKKSRGASNADEASDLLAAIADDDERVVADFAAGADKIDEAHMLRRIGEIVAIFVLIIRSDVFDDVDTLVR